MMEFAPSRGGAVGVKAGVEISGVARRISAHQNLGAAAGERTRPPTVNNYYQWGDPFQIFSYDLTVQVPDSDILNLAIGEQFLANRGILDQPSFSEFQVSSINGNHVTFQVWNLTSLPEATPVPTPVPGSLLTITISRRSNSRNI